MLCMRDLRLSYAVFVVLGVKERTPGRECGWSKKVFVMCTVRLSGRMDVVVCAAAHVLDIGVRPYVSVHISSQALVPTPPPPPPSAPFSPALLSPFSSVVPRSCILPT